MVFYLFNNNKPLKKGKNDHFFIVHYCEKCNSQLVGEWKENNINSETEKEIIEFDKIKTCPVCNSKLSSNRFHHFCNGQVLKHRDKTYSFTKSNSDYIARSAITTTRIIPDNEYIPVSKFSLRESDLPEIGSDFLTDNGVGIVSRISSNSQSVQLVYHKDTLDSISSYFERNLNIQRTEHTEEKIKAFENKYNVTKSNDFEASIQLDDKEKLKEYLKNIVDIEKNIFSISNRLRYLYYLNYEAEKDALASEKLMLFKYNTSLKKTEKKLKQLKSKKVEKEINIKDFAVSYPEKPQKPEKPQEPILAKPRFFNKKRVLAENAALTKKYENELEIYNLTNEKYVASLKEYNETVSLLKNQSKQKYELAVEQAKEILKKDLTETQNMYDELLEKQDETKALAKNKPTPEKAKHLILKDEIKAAEDLLKKYYKAKDKLYSYGILFGKYRNFVAVSSLYEYLSSGRCDTLEGPHGAYNLYENEIRMNMVISQLHQVIESLEEIKQNQYMIYSAIKESNKLLESLDSSTSRVISSLDEIKTRATNMETYMAKIADNTQVIAYNTERTAFYSKRNAELTNALGFMVALK